MCQCVSPPSQGAKIKTGKRSTHWSNCVPNSYRTVTPRTHRETHSFEQGQQILKVVKELWKIKSKRWNTHRWKDKTPVKGSRWEKKKKLMCMCVCVCVCVCMCVCVCVYLSLRVIEVGCCYCWKLHQHYHQECSNTQTYIHVGGGNRSNICLICFGGDGLRNTYPNCRSIRDGQEWRGTSSWEISSSSWTARHLETLGLWDEWYRPSQIRKALFVRCGLKLGAPVWSGLSQRFACCRRPKPLEASLVILIFLWTVMRLIFVGFWQFDFDWRDCRLLSHMIQEERRFRCGLWKDIYCWALLLLKVFVLCMSPTW